MELALAQAACVCTVYCTSIRCRVQQAARALADFAVSARAPRELAAALLAAEHRVCRALDQLLVARGDAALHGHALPRQEAVGAPLRRQALAPQPRTGLLSVSPSFSHSNSYSHTRVVSLLCQAAFCSKHVFVKTVFGESVSYTSRVKCVIMEFTLESRLRILSILMKRINYHTHTLIHTYSYIHILVLS